MSWFLSDEIPEIPADILEKLENRFDRGDCFDVAEAERERSSVRRVIAINGANRENGNFRTLSAWCVRLRSQRWTP